MDEFFAQFWNLIVTFIDPRNLVHPERYTEALKPPGAMWPSFIAVTLIVFTETGLLVGFLLPGDSMLVVVGIFARGAEWPILPLMAMLCVAAVVGDTVGYAIGKRWGPAIFKRPDSRFFKQAYLQRAKDFYEKHGGKTIIIARFIPIVRTFVPVVAGAVKMNYRTFLFYNVIGGVGWIMSMLLLGYMLDPVLKEFFPQFEIAKHIDKVILVVVLLSVSPMVYKWWAHRRAGKTAPEATVATAAGVEPEPRAAAPESDPTPTRPPG
jgi:membrane-associated protein